MDNLALIILIIFTVSIFGLIYRNWHKNDKYDERQAMIRNRGYKYAFWTLAILEIIWTMIKGFSIIKIATITNVINFYIAITVALVYDIVNRAYFSLRQQDENSVRLSGWTATIMGLVAIWLSFYDNPPLTKGVSSDFIIWIVLAISWLIVGVTILFIFYRDKHEKDQ